MKSNSRLFLIAMAWRNLRVRPGRTLLTLLGIALGVAAVLATDITTRNAANTLDGLFQHALGNAELQLSPTGKSSTVPAWALEAARHTPGVRLAVPVVRIDTVLPGALDRGQVALTAGGTVQVGKSITAEGIDPVLEPQMRVYTLVAGRFPFPGEYEVLVSRTFAEENDLRLGGDLVLYTPGGSENLEISGLLADEGAALINGGNVVFLPFDVLQQMFALEDGYSEVNIAAQEDVGADPRALAELKTALNKRLAAAVQVTYPAARADLVPSMASSYNLALSFFGIVTLFMSVFLIYNTFATSVLERTQEIGLLRAVGMRRSQVIGYVLAEAMLLALFGCALGLAGGVFLSRGLIALMRQFFQVEGSISAFSLPDLVKSASVGLLATLLATLLPANQAARTSALQALGAHGRAQQKIRPAVWIAGLALMCAGWVFLYQPSDGPTQSLVVIRLTAFGVFLMGVVLTVPLAINAFEPLTEWLAARVYGAAGMLGARNLRRSVVRSAVTVASLAISLIMIINISSLVFIVQSDAKRWLDNAFSADLLIRAPYPMRLSFGRSLEEIPGVQIASPSRIMQVRVPSASRDQNEQQHEVLFYIAVDPAQFRSVGDKVFLVGQGDPEAAWATLSQGNALFVSGLVAEEYGLSQGDRMTLLTHRGQQEFLVAGVTTEFDLNGLVVTGTYDDLKRLFGETGADQFTVKLAAGYDAEVVAQVIRDRFEKREGIQVQITRTYKDGVMSFYDKVTSLFDLLSVVAIIIGTVGITNTMTISILERTREIGMLRALGSIRNQVTHMVLAEALIIGAVSAAYGIVFGYALSRALVTVANLISGYELRYSFNWQPYLFSLLIALGVSQLATLAPARRASSLDVVAALKHE